MPMGQPGPEELHQHILEGRSTIHPRGLDREKIRGNPGAWIRKKSGEIQMKIEGARQSGPLSPRKLKLEGPVAGPSFESKNKGARQAEN